MAAVPSLEELWRSGPAGSRIFEPGLIAGLPGPVQRYLLRSIAPGTALAHAVRIRMHGSIRLKAWFPFSAEQVIRQDRGMIWRATVRMYGVPFKGYDRIIDGKAELRWKIFGVIPFLTASGPDITRSAAGRLAGESIWLPSMLVSPEVSWKEAGGRQATAGMTVMGERVELAIEIEGNGALRSVSFSRWGNPEGGAFRCRNFGGFVEREGSFGGYTIPTGMRLGWHFGTGRYESEGEFFRVRIDSAEFR